MSEITPAAELRTKIQVIKGGPLMIEGACSIIDNEGNESLKDKVFLCRCGGSNKKPYCDGTHKTLGFDK